MVTTQPESNVETVTPEDTGTTFSKLRQLMTVTGNGKQTLSINLFINSYDNNKKDWYIYLEPRETLKI